MAFVVAQNRKSLRLITQKQKHNVNTINDKDIVLNFLEELSISSFNKKAGLDMKIIVKAMNEKFNWFPVFEENGPIKIWIFFFNTRTSRTQNKFLGLKSKSRS